MYRQNIIKYTLANVNLRAAKSQSAKILTVIPKGAAIELLDAEEDWLKVRYKSLEGYVFNEYISVSKYAWTNANLRERDSRNSKLIATIPKGGLVEVIGSIGGWDRVIYEG